MGFVLTTISGFGGLIVVNGKIETVEIERQHLHSYLSRHTPPQVDRDHSGASVERNHVWMAAPG